MMTMTEADDVHNLKMRRLSLLDGGPQTDPQQQQPDLTVQSLPYVKCRESVSAVFGFDRHSPSLLPAGSRRVSTASNATTEGTAGGGGSQLSSPESDARAVHMPSTLSYSVPSTTLVTNTPRGRPAVDVIATYMNTSDSRSIKSDLLRAHAHFASPHSSTFCWICLYRIVFLDC